MGSEQGGEREGADASRETDAKASEGQKDSSWDVIKYVKLNFDFSLRNCIGSVREQINKHLDQYEASLKKANEAVKLPLSLGNSLSTNAYALSENLNNQYPYAASIFTSHPAMVMGGSVATAVAALRSKYFRWEDRLL